MIEKTVEKLAEKITSYNIFNNLFPGIIFCFILNHTTIFNIHTESILQNIFIYYFIGMITSRIGSLLIEEILKNIKIKNKNTNKKESFLAFENYSDYIVASKKDETIKVLSETNNTYRTLIALFFSLVIVKLYEIFLHNFLLKVIGKNVIIVLLFALLSVVFIFSYKKQTKYISDRIKKCKKKTEGGNL